jgi:DNA-binding Xre family transcriptional regulator
MNIKGIIEEILKDKQADFKMLAEAIGVSVEELDYSLQENQIQLRTLEMISRELRVPLYSFFRASTPEEIVSLEKFFNVDITPYREKELLKEIARLKSEIQILKAGLIESDSSRA